MKKYPLAQNARYQRLMDELQATTPTSDLAVIDLYLYFLQVAEAGIQDRQAFFDRFALSEGKLAILVLLKSAGQLTPSELAEEAGVTQGTITGLLAGLERSGLVSREPHPDDGRKATIVLTPAALVLYEHVLNARLRHIEALLSVFSTQEQQQLRALLDTLHRQLVESLTS